MKQHQKLKPWWTRGGVVFWGIHIQQTKRARIGALAVLAGLGLVTGGCQRSHCHHDGPTVRGNVTLGGGLDPAQVAALKPTVTADGKTKEFDPLKLTRGELADKSTSFEVDLGAARKGQVSVKALDTKGAILADASLPFDLGDGVCAVVTLTLRRPVDGGIDGKPKDTGPPDVVRPDAKKCGNGTIDNGEVCDSTNFGGRTCKSQGAATGNTRLVGDSAKLTCSDGCKTIDTAKCAWVSQAKGGGDASPLAVAFGPKGDIYATGYFKGTATFGSKTLTSTDRDAFVARISGTTGAFVWAEKFDSSGPHTEGEGIAVDKNGDCFVTGRFHGTMTFFDGTTLTAHGGATAPDAGSLHPDAYLVKVKADGTKVVWKEKVGGTSDDTGYSVAADSAGSIYMLGYFGGSSLTIGQDTFTRTPGTFVVKWTDGTSPKSGLPVTVDNFNYPRQLVLDGKGAAVIAGQFVGNKLDFRKQTGSWTVDKVACSQSSCSTNVVAKLDISKREFAWAEAVGSPYKQGGTSRPHIAVDTKGDVYLLAPFEKPVKVDLAAGGTKTISGPGNGDLLVGRMAGSDGSFRWVQRIGGTGADPDLPGGIGVAPTGEVVVGGAGRSPTLAFGDPDQPKLAQKNSLTPLHTELFVAGLKQDKTKAEFSWTEAAKNSKGYNLISGFAVSSTGKTVAAGYFATGTTVAEKTLTAAATIDFVFWSFGPGAP